MKKKVLLLWPVSLLALISVFNEAYCDVVVMEQSIWLLKTDSLGETIWTKTFEYNTTGSCVRETPDKEYVIGSGWGMIKTDSLGDTLWTLMLSSIASVYSALTWDQLKVTSDKSCLIIGYRPREDFVGTDIFLAKVDSLGRIAWERTYDWGFNEEAYSVIETKDTGYVVIGGAIQDEPETKKLLLLKTNRDGDTLWSFFYPGKEYAIGNCLQETCDGNLIAVGSKDDEMLLLKLDQNGRILWERTFGGEASNASRYIRNAQDCGFVTFGGIQSTLLKLSPEGDSLWLRQVDWESLCFDKTLDGGYVFVGTTRNTDPYFDMDLLLLKTDSLGNVLWKKTYGGDKDDGGWYVQQTLDGGFIVSGFRNRRVYMAEPILDSLPEEE